MKVRKRLSAALIAVLLIQLACSTPAEGQDSAPDVRHVIHISIDGLRPDVIPLLGAFELPHFFRFRQEGAWTDNARTDYDYSNTLPNHASQLLGRPVAGPEGHHWTENSDPSARETLHANRDAYMASVFDVAHDHGLRTAAYVSKSKFVLFEGSYDAARGAPDRTGADDGRDKIDAFVYEEDTAALVERLVEAMKGEAYGYTFLHLRDLDTHGHKQGWHLTSGSAYTRAVKQVDGLLGRLFRLVETTPELQGRTALLLTADHGGSGTGHGDAGRSEHHTVPFYVWGPGVGRGVDLYRLNPEVRQNPGTGRPSYEASRQPVRNGDAANLALSLLGLGTVPGSAINARGELEVSATAAEARDAAPPEHDPTDLIEGRAEGWLAAAYPNPFRLRTRFSLLLARPQHVRVAVYDLLGRRVALLFDGLLTAGTRHPFTLELARLPNGVYTISAVGERFSASRRVVLHR